MDCYKFTVNEDQLSNLMIGYWTNFAKELNPSHSENNWSQFEPDALNLIFVTLLAPLVLNPIWVLIASSGTV